MYLIDTRLNQVQGQRAIEFIHMLLPHGTFIRQSAVDTSNPSPDNHRKKTLEKRHYILARRLVCLAADYAWSRGALPPVRNVLAPFVTDYKNHACSNFSKKQLHNNHSLASRIRAALHTTKQQFYKTSSIKLPKRQ